MYRAPRRPVLTIRQCHAFDKCGLGNRAARDVDGFRTGIFLHDLERCLVEIAHDFANPGHLEVVYHQVR